MAELTSWALFKEGKNSYIVGIAVENTKKLIRTSRVVSVTLNEVCNCTTESGSVYTLVGPPLDDHKPWSPTAIYNHVKSETGL